MNTLPDNKVFTYRKIKDKYVVTFYNGVSAGEYIKGEDGYYVYFTDNNGGGFSDYVLQQLGQDLEMLNKEWDKEIQEAFDKFQQK